MKKDACTKEDFSVRELMERQLISFAKDLLEAVKKQSGYPEEMDDVKVHVELTLLKPIGDGEDMPVGMPSRPIEWKPQGTGYFPSTKEKK